jgi:predicted oxidoreductase (fatty acid repression mutant protein)
MQKSFWDAVQERRSIYGLSDEKIVTNERITEIVRDAVKHVPSPYNSQSTRAIVLFDEAHKRFWRMTLDELKKVTKPERFGDTEKKVDGSFASGYGTVLFFIDKDVVDELAAKFPLYAEKFALWSQHSSAMHQFVIWTALEAEGLGASLQHYSPLVDDAVRAAWNVPKAWQMVAQMPFGKPTMPPGEKEFESLDERVWTFES